MDDPPERPAEGAGAAARRRSWNWPVRATIDFLLRQGGAWAVAACVLLTGLAWRRPPSGRLDSTGLLGLALLVGVVVFFLWRYGREARRDPLRVRELFPFLALLLVVHAGIGRGSVWLEERMAGGADPLLDHPAALWYLVPTASGALLAALLAGKRIATVYTLFATAILALVFEGNIAYAVFVLTTHLAAIQGLPHQRSRSAVLRAGLVTGVTGAVVAAALSAVGPGPASWTTTFSRVGLAALGGAVGVPLVVAFLQPILEWIFGILTDIRLLELSNLDNPLLSDLSLRAPGSYNHSIVVGTLAVAAADAIGANALFCRVAAYYHDIGKMRMPEYYIENQRPGQNPHDRLAPAMSALILANHVREGIRLGREHGLPEPILDIIPQHHGTRVMTYFHEKGKAEAAAAGLPAPDPDAFRHPGPKPQTREAAIFMLADSVEAAGRTIAEPTDEKFRNMIRQITSRVILDGQLESCELTFSDLEKITEAFVRALMSIYHHRIDYPTFIFEGAAARRSGRAGGRGGDVGGRETGA